jgi:hypothetical protein
MFKATLTDAQRFAKYQSLITRLLAIDSFQKSDVFKNGSSANRVGKF